jgi:hypothetical protein
MEYEAEAPRGFENQAPEAFRLTEITKVVLNRALDALSFAARVATRNSEKGLESSS